VIRIKAHSGHGCQRKHAGNFVVFSKARLTNGRLPAQNFSTLQKKSASAPALRGIAVFKIVIGTEFGPGSDCRQSDHQYRLLQDQSDRGQVPVLVAVEFALENGVLANARILNRLDRGLDGNRRPYRQLPRLRP
jgi:hypothetical protein